MPRIETSSLVLAIGVAMIALALLFWQEWERRGRSADLSEEDAGYFVRQDWRRRLVGFIMLLLAAGVYFGSRLDHEIGHRPNPAYLRTWIAIFALLLLLLGLALVDWLATRGYARRQRRAILREGLEIVREEVRRRRALAFEYETEDADEEEFES